MPDARGRFRGISLAGVDLPWDRTNGPDGGGEGAEVTADNPTTSDCCGVYDCDSCGDCCGAARDGLDPCHGCGKVFHPNRAQGVTVSCDQGNGEGGNG